MAGDPVGAEFAAVDLRADRMSAAGTAIGSDPGGDMASLAGALDPDLGLSPLFNTMPVLRHRLLDSGPRAEEFLTVWVSVPCHRLPANRRTDPSGLESQFMLDSLALPDLPTLRGERVILRSRRPSDIDDRLAQPIDAQEEDGYGSAWRRQWDGRRYHTREHLTAGSDRPPEPGDYRWAVEYAGHCIGHAGLRVNADQHRASYSVGVFVADLRGRGLGRDITRSVVSWAFGVLGVHRVELEVLSSNDRAIRCYEACGFRHEGVRREAELYPDGWKDFLRMGLLRSEYESGSDHPR